MATIAMSYYGVSVVLILQRIDLAGVEPQRLAAAPQHPAAAAQFVNGIPRIELAEADSERTGNCIVCPVCSISPRRSGSDPHCAAATVLFLQHPRPNLLTSPPGA